MYSVPIVDVIMVNENEYANKIYFLVEKNVLCVPPMPFNLIPLFILQEAGLVFNDRSLIYTEPDMRDIYVYDHSIIENHRKKNESDRPGPVDQ